MVLPIKQKPGSHQVWKQLAPNTWYNRAVLIDSKGTQYSQSTPVDRPLPYKRQYIYEVKAEKFPSGAEIPDVAFEPGFSSSDDSLAYSRAYAKFVSSLKPSTAELGINLAQARLTHKLLVDTYQGFMMMQKMSSIVGTLDRFAVEVRLAGSATSRGKRQFYRHRAARILGCRPTSDREVRRRMDGQLLRHGITGFSAEYLAFHYGWSPLIKDLYSLAEILSKGTKKPAGEFFQASGSAYGHKVVRDGSSRTQYKYKVAYKIGAIANTTSDILFVANILGLANPATVAWDVVKFSFVVDWFGNFSQIISAPTDFVGIALSNGYRTRYITWETDRLVLSKEGEGYHQVVAGYDITRTTDHPIPIPSFYGKIPFGRDWRKAVAQISLLTMFGLKPRK